MGTYVCLLKNKKKTDSYYLKEKFYILKIIVIKKHKIYMYKIKVTTNNILKHIFTYNKKAFMFAHTYLR